MPVSQKTRNLILPMSMILGGTFHTWVSKLNFLTPVFIFVMLYITFSRVSVKELRVKWVHLWMLLFQAVVSASVYLLLRPFDEVLAQGVMICVFAPTAMASVVIGSMLGANVNTMTTFTLLCNLMAAVAAPFLFSVIAPDSTTGFIYSALIIFKRVGLVLLVPFFAAWATERWLKGVHRYVQEHQIWSFYVWSWSLTVLMGSIVNYLADQSRANLPRILWLCGLALVICLFQFWAGRFIGGRYGDKVAGGQGLGQKNTLLAIWMAQSYLNPLSSVAPAAYVIWQNCVNSYQLWRKNRTA